MRIWIAGTLVLCAAQVAAQTTVIHAGHVIDGKQARVSGPMTIQIEGKEIVSIDSGYQPGPEDAVVIDLKDHWVLPGLIDLHTHLSGKFSGPHSYNEGLRMNIEDYAYRSTVHAKTTLMAGFTTVREVGGNISIALRNAIAKGWVVGPRIFAAGQSLATTGGHADRTNGLNREIMGDPGPKEGVVNGPAAAAKAVRQRYKNGADLIKITATGGVLSFAKNGLNPQFTEEEVRAIVETATDYEMHVAAHAHGAEGMKRALRAGVRTIEHGTFMDEETIALFIEKGAYLVPTLLAGDYVAEKAEIDGYYPEIVRPKAASTGPAMLDMFRRAHEAGVKIAFGTDCGVSPHGDNPKEFALMVEGGMTPMEAIRAATMVAAEVLGETDRLGSIEAGKLADIVAVREDPNTNIRTLEDVAFVMKEGVVYKQ